MTRLSSPQHRNEGCMVDEYDARWTMNHESKCHLQGTGTEFRTLAGLS